jgi:hypothetical protein
VKTLRSNVNVLNMILEMKKNRENEDNEDGGGNCRLLLNFEQIMNLSLILVCYYEREMRYVVKGNASTSNVKNMDRILEIIKRQVYNSREDECGICAEKRLLREEGPYSGRRLSFDITLPNTLWAKTDRLMQDLDMSLPVFISWSIEQYSINRINNNLPQYMSSYAKPWSFILIGWKKKRGR